MAENNHYAAIIDSGSSGSRIYLYFWNNEVGGSNITDIHQHKIKNAGALANCVYVHDKKIPRTPTAEVQREYEIKDAVGLHLDPLFESAKKALLSHHIRNTIMSMPNLRAVNPRNTLRQNHPHTSLLLKHIPDTTVAEATVAKKDIADYLWNLLHENIRNTILSELLPATPIYLLATGGMRKLQQINYPAYEILRTKITENVSDSGFQVQSPVWEIISGEDEALFGWVAANYHDKRFAPDMPTYGFVEMGGESVQFAMSVEKQLGDYTGELRVVRISGRQFGVYVKTWMGLGGQAALKRQKLRWDEQNAAHEDPCCLRKDEVETKPTHFRDCFEQCLGLLNCPNEDCRDGNLCVFGDALGKASKERTPDLRVGCLLRGIMSDNPSIQFPNLIFRGTSVFFHTTRGIFSNDNEDCLENIWNTIDKQKNWTKDELTARNRLKKLPAEFLDTALFTTSVALSILFYGFGIPMPKAAHALALQFAKARAQAAHTKAVRNKKVVDQDFKLALSNLLGGYETNNNPHISTCAQTVRKRPTTANLQDLTDVVRAQLPGEPYNVVLINTPVVRVKYDALIQARQQVRRTTNILDALPANKVAPPHGNFEYLSVDPDTVTWTLGRVVLHVNRWKRDARIKKGWESVFLVAVPGVKSGTNVAGPHVS